MPLIQSVQVRFGAPADVRIVFDCESLAACDSCCIEVGADDQSSAGLTVRVERGCVSDAHVWDPHRRRRHQLGAEAVMLTGRELTCRLPATLVSRLHGRRFPTARLIINGVLVQSRFPVGVLAPATQLEPA